jgi:hypothetical protein
MGRHAQPTKRSEHELKRLVEQGVVEVCGLDRSGLTFHVLAVEVGGHPPSAIKAWAVLHFTSAGSPYCCVEPSCHLGLFGAVASEVSDHVRRAMGLEQDLVVDLHNYIRSEYHDGVQFVGRTT